MDKSLKGKRKSRKRNARGEGDHLRNDLINAASKLLARIGPNDQFSLRAVAKEAKVAAPSVYLHFKDLNQLFLAVLENLFQEQISLRNLAEEEAAKNGASSWERLLARIYAQVRFGLKYPGHYKVMFEGRVVLSLNNPKEAAFGRAIQSRNAALISEILKENPSTERVSFDPDHLALLLWSGVSGVISLQINKPTIEWPDACELASQIAEALIRPKK